MRPVVHALVPVLAFTLAACTGGGDKPAEDTARGEDMLYSPCVETPQTVAMDETLAAFGATPAALFAPFASPYGGTATYAADSATIGINLSYAQPDAATFLDREPNTGGSGDTGGMEAMADTAASACPDALLFTLTANLHTDDGQLAETFSAAISLESADAAQLSGEVAVADLEGTWSSPDYQPADYTELDLQISAALAADGSVSGEVGIFGAQEFSDGTASASMDSLLTWTGLAAVE